MCLFLFRGISSISFPCEQCDFPYTYPVTVFCNEYTTQDYSTVCVMRHTVLKIVLNEWETFLIVLIGNEEYVFTVW